MGDGRGLGRVRVADGGRRGRAADGGRGSVEVVLGEAGGPGGAPFVPTPAAAASGEGGGAPFVPTSAAPGKGGGGEEAEEGGDPRGGGRGGGRRRREAVEEGFAEDEHFGVPLARVGCCSSAVSMVGELPQQSESDRGLAWAGRPRGPVRLGLVRFSWISLE